jgi:hypothetical protein
MRSAKGEKLFKRIEIKIFFEGKILRKVFRSQPRQGFTSDGIQQVLEKVSDDLEEKFPGVEFRLVERGENQFSLIHEPSPAAR